MEFATLYHYWRDGATVAGDLVHNADITAWGTWTVDEDGGGVTLDVTYELRDIMDLHPIRHPLPDGLAWVALELGWNRIATQDLIARLLDMPVAQPYLLTITSDPMTEHWTATTWGTDAPVTIARRD